MSKVRKRERDVKVCDLTCDDDDEMQTQNSSVNSAVPRINTRRSVKIKNSQASVVVEFFDEKIIFAQSDIETLDEGSLLNDAVIDFYCRWLEKQLPKEIQSRVHIFSSYLYTKLLSESTENGTQGVAKWTKETDIFEKDFLFFPVCEKLHWTLVVVCYPGAADMDHELDAKCADRAKRSVDTTPCILHFNSLRTRKPHILRRIKKYLQDEWARRKEGELGPRDFSGLMDITPPCPQQKNMCDCGVFVLEFLERLLSAPLPMLAELAAATPAERFRFLRDRSGWFTAQDVREKRAAIRDLICRPK